MEPTKLLSFKATIICSTFINQTLWELKNIYTLFLMVPNTLENAQQFLINYLIDEFEAKLILIDIFSRKKMLSLIFP